MVLHLLATMVPEKTSALDRQKHIKYWKRASMLMPDAFTPLDSNRMSLGYFMVVALDLLNALDVIELAEQESWIEWVYSCQVDTGGFRGSSSMSLGEARNQENRYWEPATVPGTFFALCILLVLGDDLARVKMEKLLSWLAKLQRPDGTIGEFLFQNDKIEGGLDLRICLCGTAVAWMLQDNTGGASKPVFDVERMKKYIMSCQVC